MALQRWSPQPRAGISPQRVVLRGAVPVDGVTYVAAAAGDSPFKPGESLIPGTPLSTPVPAWFHPETGPEPEHLLALDVPVIAETEDLLVIDKPHGLPSTPNGALMRATAQTLLRVRRDEPDLVAAHRLDRLTGGVLVLSRRQATRGFIQTQFQRHSIRKVYEATVAAGPDEVDAQLARRGEMGAEVASGQRTRVDLAMRKTKGQPQVEVVEAGEGKPTTTWVTRTGEREFRLEPLTGHTHQLRVLLNHCGLPIEGDDTYPIYAPSDVWDADAKKLQLRSTQLELDLPDGQRRRFSLPQ